MKTERLVATVGEDRNRPETVSLNVLLTSTRLVCCTREPCIRGFGAWRRYLSLAAAEATQKSC